MMNSFFNSVHQRQQQGIMPLINSCLQGGVLSSKLRLLLLVGMVCVGGNVWGDSYTARYKIEGGSPNTIQKYSDAVTFPSDASRYPLGSSCSVSYSQEGSSKKITTLTLTGFDGCSVSDITVILPCSLSSGEEVTIRVYTPRSTADEKKITYYTYFGQNTKPYATISGGIGTVEKNESITISIESSSYDVYKLLQEDNASDLTWEIEYSANNLTCNPPTTGGGTYSVKVGEETETISTVTTLLVVGADQTVTLTPTLYNGYALASTPFTVQAGEGLGAYSDVTLSTNESTYTFTMPNKDVTVTAYYIASHSRSVANGNWATICLPYSVAASGITGATMYSIAGKRMNVNTPTSIVLTEVTEGLTQGQPYIFCATASQQTFTSSGTIITTAGSNNGLIGSFSKQKLSSTSGLYVLKNNKVCPVGEGVYVGAYKAYIQMSAVPTYTGATVKGMLEMSFNDATGLGLIFDDGDSNDKQAVRFNLAGQPVSEGYKGIVIENGKKILMK